MSERVLREKALYVKDDLEREFGSFLTTTVTEASGDIKFLFAYDNGAGATGTVAVGFFQKDYSDANFPASSLSGFPGSRGEGIAGVIRVSIEDAADLAGGGNPDGIADAPVAFLLPLIVRLAKNGVDIEIARKDGTPAVSDVTATGFSGTIAGSVVAIRNSNRWVGLSS